MDRLFGKKRIKRALSLIEVGIALFLTSLILTVLLKIFFQFPVLEKNLDQSKKKTYPTEYTQVKLHSVFSKIVPKEHLPEDLVKYGSLKTYEENKKPCLFVIFNNSIDLDPSFRGEVIGKIFWENKELSLVIWPSEKGAMQYRKDVLLSNVLHVSWQFFNPEPLDEQGNKATPCWQNHWKHSSMPPMIQLLVTFSNNKKEKFVFFPTSGFAMVTYQSRIKA